MIDMTLEERIKQEKLQIEENWEKLAHIVTLDNQYAFDICMQNIEEHVQIAEWLKELKALRLLLDWAIECDFGLDSFPEEYAKYKHTLTDDMTYKDMIIQIAKCVVTEQLKE